MMLLPEKEVQVKEPKVIIDNVSLRINRQDSKYILALILLWLCLFSSVFVGVSFFLNFYRGRLTTVLLIFGLFKLSELGYNFIVSKNVRVIYYPENEIFQMQMGKEKQVFPITALKEVTSRGPMFESNLFVDRITTVLINEKTYIFSTNKSKGVDALRNLERFYLRHKKR